MRRLAAVPVILLLAGCGPSFPTIDKAALMEAVAAVRIQTIKVCSYVPSDESLIAILTTELPFAETALAIAQQICAAVTASVPITPVQAPRMGDAEQCPMVRGTCITGQFILPDATHMQPPPPPPPGGIGVPPEPAQ